MADEAGKKKLTRREVLAALLLIVTISVIYDWTTRQNELAVNQACAKQLEDVRSAINKWIATVDYRSRSGSYQTCNAAKTLVTRYDASCGPLIGTLPVIQCEGDAQSSAAAADAGDTQKK